MRARRDYKRSVTEPKDTQTVSASPKPKTGKFEKPMGFLRSIIDNPNFGYQIVVILLTLASDNMGMERRISTMTNSLDAVRGITDVLNGTIKSLRAASEAPQLIRRLMQPPGDS